MGQVRMVFEVSYGCLVPVSNVKVSAKLVEDNIVEVYVGTDLWMRKRVSPPPSSGNAVTLTVVSGEL